jgi:hypothetical protein
MADEQRSQVDIEIEFPLVNFGGGKNGDDKAKTAMFNLTHEAYSPFNGCQAWQVFIFCCTYGFAHKKVRKTPPGAPAMPPSAFKSDTRDVMRTIAIADTKDLRIIKRASGKNGYVRICEEYAYSALSEVYNRILSFDDGKENSGEDVLNKMIKEIEESRS